MTTTKPITPDHIFEMTGASAPSLAPDGDTLVITKQTIRRETMETISVLMISQRSVMVSSQSLQSSPAAQATRLLSSPLMGKLLPSRAKLKMVISNCGLFQCQVAQPSN